MFNVKIIRWPDLDLKNDFDSTGALIANLDLVVTVGTAVNPLSASSGTPVYLMAGKGWPNLGTDFYPWFNNVTCFLPKTTGGISSCIPDVASAIQKLILENKVTTL